MHHTSVQTEPPTISNKAILRNQYLYLYSAKAGIEKNVNPQRLTRQQVSDCQRRVNFFFDNNPLNQ